MLMTMTFPPPRFHRGSNPPGPEPAPHPPRRLALGFIAIVAVPWLASFATDWLWFREIHFESVFLASLVARAAAVRRGRRISRSRSYM